MRCHKGMGRSFARKCRLKVEEAPKGISPKHMRQIQKDLLPACASMNSIEREKKVVVSCEDVRQAVNDLGIRHPTARVRRKLVQVLKFERRDNWT